MKTVGYNSWFSWFATLALAVTGFLLLIPMRLAGLFYVVLIDRYDTDRKNATIPIVVFGILRSLSGPLVGYLGEVFGLRSITLIGCILAAIGIGGCYFADDIVVIIVSLGFIYGMGLSLGHTLVPAILRQHFTKNINLVNGVYMCGSCLGATVMSPVIQCLIEKYGVSGMFLILGGILLHCIPACIILSNPHNSKSESKNNDAPKENGIEKEGDASCNEKTVRSDKETNLTMYNSKENEKSYTNQAFDDESEKIIFNKHSAENKIHFSFNNSEVKQKIVNNSQEIKLVRVTSSNEEIVRESTEKVIKVECGESKIEFNNVKNKKISCESFKLFLDPTFHIIMVVQSLHGFFTTMNWTVLVDFGRDKGISTDDAVYFVMFLPIAGMIGNLTLNWMTDRQYLSRANFSVICFLILGIDSGYMVWAYNFVSMMIGVLVFGFVSGAAATTFPGIIMESFEEDQQNMAFASRFILYSFLCLTKSPLIGYFRGELGSYNWIYYMILIINLCCAILLKFTPLAADYRRKKNLKGSF